eukprot:TRINITY_DN121372_c0_g1_i1.p1 TRINITY_DN121372_c0_g1~~TRINITY_DN121372_c0_g1_i1.p1  ORF type:complete len:201 (-),score=28.58 TRINITY_DN121372_c0_g1_i1:277-879(-)
MPSVFGSLNSKFAPCGGLSGRRSGTGSTDVRIVQTLRMHGNEASHQHLHLTRSKLGEARSRQDIALQYPQIQPRQLASTCSEPILTPFTRSAGLASHGTPGGFETTVKDFAGQLTLPRLDVSDGGSSRMPTIGAATDASLSGSSIARPTLRWRSTMGLPADFTEDMHQPKWPEPSKATKAQKTYSNVIMGYAGFTGDETI